MGRRTRTGAVLVAIATAAVLSGCGFVSNASHTDTGVHVVDTSQPFPSDPPTSAPPPSAAPPSTSTATSSAQPAATIARIPDKPLQCPKQPTTTGKPQSAKTVLNELEEVAGVNEYVVAKLDPASLDSNLNNKLPKVTIPLKMLKAVAAEESSWTSNCVSGDGRDAYGIMQLDGPTTDLINLKFHTGLSRTDPYQNIKLGNAYLEYLTVHFGIEYFHNDFDISSNTKLRTVVLAAYNTGIGTVDPSLNGSTPYHVGPVGQQYADTIVALMNSSQPCQKTWGH